MRVTALGIEPVVVLEPTVFEDDRGFFFESWNEKRFDELIETTRFVQDNHSSSARGVFRGLHYQAVKPQGKLVRVVSGAVFDVAVDIRPGSDSFGSWVGAEISSDNKRQIWVPPGFAHGFLALADGTEVLYKTTEFYIPEYDRSILWSDPDISLELPDAGIVPLVSDKDAVAPRLRDIDLDEVRPLDD